MTKEFVFGVRVVGDGKSAEDAAARVEKGFDRLGGSVERAGQQAARMDAALAALGGAGVLYGIKQVADTVLAFGNSMVAVQVQADKLRSTMQFAFDAATASREMSYIAQTADRLGLDLGSAAAAYGKLAAAAKGTALAGEPARRTFEAVASAATVMGLSAQEADGALLAISQMISKGTVSAEELRGQLGERLPGAFQIAARAMGVTTAELGKMLEQGQIATADFLPKFADELLKTLGDSPQSAAGQAQATLNRLSSSWLTFKQGIAATGWSQFFVDEMKGMTVVLKDSAQAMEEARRRGWGGAGQTIAGIGGALYGFDTAEEQRNKVKREIVETERMVREYEAKASRSSGYLTITDRQTLTGLRADLSGLEAQLRGMTVTAGKIQMPDLAAEAQKQADAIKTAGDAAFKVWDENKLATKAERQAASLAKLAQEYEAAYTAGIKLGRSEKELAAIVSTYTARSAELMKGPASTADAKRAATEAGQVLKEQFANRLDAVKQGLTREEALLDAAHARGEIDEREHLRRVAEAQMQSFVERAAVLKQQLAVTADASERQKIVGEVQKLGADAAKAADVVALAYIKLDQAVQKALSSITSDAWKDVLAVGADNEKLREEFEMLGMTTEQLTAYKVQKIDAARVNAEVFAKSLEDTAAAMTSEKKEVQEARQLYLDMAVAKRAYAQGLGEQAALIPQMESKRAWVDFIDGVEGDLKRGMTDAIFRGFEDGNGAGKSFAKNFSTTLANTLKATPIKIGAQLIVDTGAGMVRSALGAGGSAGNVLGTGNALYTASQGGGLYGQFAMSSAGQALGLSTGSMAAATYTSAATSAAAAGELAAAEMYMSAAATTASTGAAALSSIGAALPWVGAALMVGSMLFSHKGGPKTAGDAVYSLADGRASLQADLGDENFGGFFTPSGDNAKMAEAFKPVAATLAQTIQRLTGNNARLGTVGIGYDTDPQGTAGSRISSRVTDASGNVLYHNSIEAGRDEAKLQSEMTAEMSRVALASIRAADIPGKVGEFLRSSMSDTVDGIAALTKEQADALTSAATGGWLPTLLNSLDASAVGFAGVADMATEMAARLPTLQAQYGLTADSIGNAVAAIANAPSAAQAGADFAGTVTNGIYDALQSQSAGQITNVVMSEMINPMLTAIALGGDLATVLSDDMINQAVSRVGAIADAYDVLLSDPRFVAVMDRIGTGASRIGSAAYVAQPARYEVPDYQAAQQEAERKAEEDARKAADLAKTRREKDIEVMRLSGDAAGALAAQRALELESMDASLRPLQERINALTDEQVALDEIARIRQSVSDTWRTIAQLGMSDYERQLDDLSDSYQRQTVEIAKLATGQAAATATLNEWADAQHQLIDANNAVSEFSGAIGRLQTAMQLAGRAADVRASMEDEAARVRGDTAEQQAARLGTRIDALVVSATAQWGMLSDAERLDAAEKVKGLVAQRYDIEAAAIKTAQDEAKTLGATWRDVAKGVREYLDNLALSDKSALTNAQKLLEARRKFDSTLAAGLGGDDKAAAKATSVADVYLGLAQDRAASRLEFAHVQADIVNGLSGLATSSDTTADAQDRIATGTADLKRIQSQALGYLGLIDTAMGDVDASISAATAQALADSQTWSGIATSLGAEGAIASAIKQLPSSLAALINSGTPVTASATAGAAGAVMPNLSASLLSNYVGLASSGAMSLTAAYAAASKVASANEIAQAWTQAHPENPVTGQDLESWSDAQGIRRYASGGMHSGGLRLVGERGPELEVTGPARYFDAGMTRDLMHGTGMPEWARALIGEIAALRGEVAQLKSAANKTADNTRDTKATLDMATEKGKNMRTKVVG